MKKSFRGLNGLRFFAALAVVCFHVIPSAAQFKSWPMFLQNLTLSGPIALGFFFILSGFVLAHAYSSRPPQTAQKRKAFWWARIARLYPVYLLAHLLFLPMAYEKYLHHASPGGHGVRTFLAGGILSIFAVQAWTPLSQAWNGPSWSLSVEAFFYLLFPFVMIPILRFPRMKLFLLLGTLWAAMLAFPISHGLGIVSDGLWRSWIENNPLFWMPLFLFGIALYRWSGHWSAMSDRAAAWYGAVAIAILIVLCGVASPSLRELFISGGAAPVLGLIVLAYSHSTSLFSRAMGTTFLFEAGATSYITYILQSPIRHIFELVHGKIAHSGSHRAVTPLNFVLYVVLLLTISFAVQHLFEKPSQRWILARVSPRPAAVPLDVAIEAV